MSQSTSQPRAQVSIQAPGTSAPAPTFAATHMTDMYAPVQSVQPMEMLGSQALDALTEQLKTKIKLEAED